MRVPERIRDTKGNGCVGEEVMVVGTSRCSLSLSSLEATRNLGRPVVRSVGRSGSVGCPARGQAWQVQTSLP